MSDNDEVGFDRPNTEPLRGTVKHYARHLFICTGRTDWPERIELGGGFPQALWDAIVEQHILSGEIVADRWRGAMATEPGQRVALGDDGPNGVSNG